MTDICTAARAVEKIGEIHTDLVAIVGEMIFGEGTDASLQRTIDLCNAARVRHDITRETWGGAVPLTPHAADDQLAIRNDLIEAVGVLSAVLRTRTLPVCLERTNAEYVLNKHRDLKS